MKGPIKRMKRQITEWEEIFANDMFNKELLAKIHGEHLKVHQLKNK